MRCRKVRNKLDLLARQELTPLEHAQIEAHLEACAACRESLGKARKLEDLLLTAPVPAVPEGFAARVVSEARTCGGGAVRPERRTRLEHPAWKRARVSVGTAAALAAGILLGISMGYQTWQSGRSATAAPARDLLAASGLEPLAEPGGDSLAESYLSLTMAGDFGGT